MEKPIPPQPVRRNNRPINMAERLMSEDLVFISGRDSVSDSQRNAANSMDRVGSRISDMLF